MVVNIDFAGKVQSNKTPLQRQAVSSVRLSGDSLRRHEQIMEYRNKVNVLNADLQSAMASLASANADIDRLNAELATAYSENDRLKKELLAEREKSARFAKKNQKNGRFSIETTSVDPH